jgi:hypothetical protein
MFKFFFLLPLILLLSCSDMKTKPDCSRFKDGKFLLRNNYNRTKFIIERKGGIQTELNESTDTIKTFRITWLDKCEYELTKISERKKTITNPSDDQGEVKYRDEKPIKVTITATTDSYYVFEVKITGFYRVYTDTIWKLNR